MTKEKEIEKPRGWANLRQQLKEVREESFKQGVWEGKSQAQKDILKDEIEFLKGIIKTGWDNWKNRAEAEDMGMEKEFDVRENCKNRIKKLTKKIKGDEE